MASKAQGEACGAGAARIPADSPLYSFMMGVSLVLKKSALVVCLQISVSKSVMTALMHLSAVKSVL